MKTGISRFILRVIVGVLMFAIGVGASILLGGFSPFRSYSPTSYEKSKGCGYRRHSRSSTVDAPEAEPKILLLKGRRAIRVGNGLSPLPAIPPVANAPVPPSAPRESR